MNMSSTRLLAVLMLKSLFLLTISFNLISCDMLDSEKKESSDDWNFAPESVLDKHFTFYKDNQEKWSFKVYFGEDVKIITSSSYFSVEISEASYEKMGENTATFDCYFTAYTTIGGNKLGTWNQYELQLTFLSGNHGKYNGKRLANPEDFNGTPVSGMFVYNSELGIESFVANENYGDTGNNQLSNQIDLGIIPKSIWIDTDAGYDRYLSFDSEQNYRHYFELENNILKETGKYIVNKDNSTLKLLRANGSVQFDFKLIKLTKSEMWLGSYDTIAQKYPLSPNIILKASTDADKLPSFISDINLDINISAPVIENIDEHTAIIKGSVLGTNVKFQDRGICYSTEPNPTIEDSYVSYSANIIDKSISDLFSGTTYYVRLYAKINNEYYYGEEESFITLGERVMKLVFKEVKEISNLEKSLIDLTVKLPNEVGMYGLCYGKSPKPQITDNYIAERNRKTSWTLTNIECGYDYYVRGYHIDGSNVIYYEDSEVKISPVNKKQIQYEFKYNFSNYKYDVPYFLTILLSEMPKGTYSVQPWVWRYKDAYYKEHEGKNYDKPLKYVEIKADTNTVEFSNKISVPEPHQMYGEDYRYFLQYFEIIPIDIDHKTIRITTNEDL